MRKSVLFILFVILSVAAFAQRPKMTIRVYGGVTGQTFVSRTDSAKIRDNFGGYVVGFGFRVAYKKIFGEIDLDWKRSGLTLFFEEETGLADLNPAELRFNSFEIPTTFGYILIRKPVFKWGVYTGPVQRFMTNGSIKTSLGDIDFKPRDADLRAYNLDWRFGTQMDIAFFNLDVRYSVGVTNSFSDNIRTNSHQVSILFGFIF